MFEVNMTQSLEQMLHEQLRLTLSRSAVAIVGSVWTTNR